MLTLLLARHGQTEWNNSRRMQGHTDTVLNSTGHQQAARLAIRLAAEQIDAIYTSDLSRAAQTAATIAGGLGREAIPDPRLREMGFGVIEGLTFDEAQARHGAMVDAWLSDYDQPPEGGEAYSDFSARLDGFLEWLRARHEGDTVLLVTHGGPIAEILRLALQLPPSGHWYFKVDNASLSELRFYGDHPLLARLNETAYLG